MIKIGNTEITDVKIGSTDISEVRLGTNLIWQRVSIPPFTADFIAATGISDVGIIAALTNMEAELTAAGLIAYGGTSIIKALYPFVGGTAGTHKYNFMDARDLDAAFRLTFYGGWTHASTGAQPNGTNGYADTHFVPSVDASLNSIHLSYYSRTDNNTGDVEIGSYSALGSETYTLIRFSDGNKYRSLNRGGSVGGGTISRTDGFMIGTRNNSATEEYYFRNSLVSSESASSSSASSKSLFLGGYQNPSGISAAYTNRECAGATLGLGLNSTQAGQLYTAIQNLNTALGRQV